MKYQICEADKLMWPGKYGLVCAEGEEKGFSLEDWQHSVAESSRIVEVPAGRKAERASFVFASDRDLGRVELVYHHGYVWPVNPPPAGRAIMEELVEHLNRREGLIKRSTE